MQDELEIKSDQERREEARTRLRLNRKMMSLIGKVILSYGYAGPLRPSRKQPYSSTPASWTPGDSNVKLHDHMPSSSSSSPSPPKPPPLAPVVPSIPCHSAEMPPVTAVSPSSMPRTRKPSNFSENKYDF